MIQSDVFIFPSSSKYPSSAPLYRAEHVALTSTGGVSNSNYAILAVASQLLSVLSSSVSITLRDAVASIHDFDLQDPSITERRTMKALVDSGLVLQTGIGKSTGYRYSYGERLGPHKLYDQFLNSSAGSDK